MENTSNTQKFRIAFFYPWLKTRGGGEKLVLNWLKNNVFFRAIFFFFIVQSMSEHTFMALLHYEKTNFK